MASDSYDLECMRAELLGLEKPDKEQFLLQEAERKKNEQETLENEETKELDIQEESMGRTGGKLDELNSILSKTQQKLNRFKQTACGSFSSVFKGSFDRGSDSNHKDDDNSIVKNDENSISDTTKIKNDSQQKNNCGDINDTLDNLDNLQSNFKSDRDTSLNIQKKMTSHLDKLDTLIMKADQAELSMAHQTKQMKKFVGK